MKIFNYKDLLIYLLIIIFLYICLPVTADDISLSTDQAEYYFLTGEERNIPFTIDSQFSGTMEGTLQYSLLRNQDQGGYSLSQTSTQSQSFPVTPGRSVHALTLGSDVNASYQVDLTLYYPDKGKDYAVVLPPISVYFVDNQKEIKEEKNTLRSSTSEVPQNQMSPGIQNQMSSIDQQIQQMEQEQNQMLQQMMASENMGTNSPSNPSSQDPNQVLQNNQMSSSSSALKQQLAQETEDNKKTEEDLKVSLEQDPLLTEQVKELQKAGYNQTYGKIIPSGSGKGEVSTGFKDTSGNQVSVQGNIENNSVKSLSAKSSGEIPVPSSMDSNETWNTLKKSLSLEGMVPGEGTITRTPGNIRINQTYSSTDGKNATIMATIVNGSVSEIKVVKDDSYPVFWFFGILMTIMLVVLCLGVAVWYYSVRIKRKGSDPGDSVITIPVDFRQNVLDMIENARIRYNDGDKKEGYVLLGQATRIYLSCRYGTGAGLTTEEVLSHSFMTNINIKDQIAEGLKLCSMVEYAKEEPDDEFFHKFLDYIHEIVNKDSK